MDNKIDLVGDINSTFMYNGQEYKIVHKNYSKSRVIIEPIGKIKLSIELNDKIIINNIYFRIIYIRSTKKKLESISIELIK